MNVPRPIMLLSATKGNEFIPEAPECEMISSIATMPTILKSEVMSMVGIGALGGFGGDGKVTTSFGISGQIRAFRVTITGR